MRLYIVKRKGVSMSEQGTNESEQEVSEEPKDLPCIYGSEIREACSVRQEARKNMPPDMSKWIKPNIGDEHFRELGGMMNRAMEALTSMNLDRFCDHCPWRDIYIKKHP